MKAPRRLLVRQTMCAIFLGFLFFSAQSLAEEEDGVELTFWSKSFNGAIAGKQVQVFLEAIGSRVTGSYCEAPCESRVSLRGRQEKGRIALTETTYGKQGGKVVIGQWNLMPQNGGWKGTWSSPDGRESQAITLTENITRTENNSGIRPFPYEIRIVASEDPGEHDDSDDCSNAPLVSEIRLYQEDRLVQTLPSSSEEGPCGMFLPETVDINFDGYPDLRQGLFVATNIPYSYWLYDPDTQKMVDLEEGIEGGESTVFDPVHKTIVVDWRSGCCSHGVNIYAWQGKNPVKVDSAESYYQAEMINGKLTSCYITPSYQNGRIEYPGAVYQEGDVFRFMSREGWSCIDDYILSHTRIHIWQSDQPPPEKLKLLRTEEVRWNKTMTNDGKTVYCPEIPVFNNGKIERWLLKDECTNTPMGDGE